MPHKYHQPDDSRETALNHIEESEHLATSTQPYDPYLHIHVLWQKAYLELCLGFDDQAYETANMSIQISQSGDRWVIPGYLEKFLEVDDRLGVALTLSFLSTYHHQVGNFHQAYLCYIEIFCQYTMLVEINFHWLENFGLLLVESQASPKP